MGSCLCKSSEYLSKSKLHYPMNDLSSVFKSEPKNNKESSKGESNNGKSSK